MYYEHMILRHGPKDLVNSHITGTEANLDESNKYLIHNFFKEYALQKIKNKGQIRVNTTSLDRNFKTAEIAVSEIINKGLNCIGPNIEDRLGANVGTKGKIQLLSPELPIAWGESEKNYQTSQGVRKEDRGLYSWINDFGFDFSDNGISLREVAYRISSFVLDSLNLYDNGGLTSFDVSISNSGYIEPFVYLLLEDQLINTSPDKILKLTGGALQPISGIKINYFPNSSDFDLHILNGNFSVSYNFLKKQLEEQKNWLLENGRSRSIFYESLSGLK